MPWLRRPQHQHIAGEDGGKAQRRRDAPVEILDEGRDHKRDRRAQHRHIGSAISAECGPAASDSFA